MGSDAKALRFAQLESVGHNPCLIPEEFVQRDYLTDSLLKKKPCAEFDISSRDVKYNLQRGGALQEVVQSFRDLFGFDFVVPVAQGRTAEAILFKLAVSNGHYLPGSALFPTTKVHQELNGGTPVDVMHERATVPSDAHPFKGDLSLKALESVVLQFHKEWTPFISVEPCNNATGGHPTSLANMREIRKFADRHGILIYLDGCRLLENAIMLQQREKSVGGMELWSIVREFASCADVCTMSATKDFPSPIGGFFATRVESLYHEFLDLVIALGSGLSYVDEAMLSMAMVDPQRAAVLVEEKVKLVARLHQGLRDYYPLVEPLGGHAVFLDWRELDLQMPDMEDSLLSFTHYLYAEYGIRAAENLASARQKEHGIRLLRLAVPLIGEDQTSIDDTIAKLRHVREHLELIPPLVKESQPPGLTGAMRAKYSVA